MALTGDISNAVENVIYEELSSPIDIYCGITFS
jgi:hypothetical protein